MVGRGKNKRWPTEPVTLEIDRLSHEGRGIGNIEGKVAFVEGALPGEKVSAQFINRRRQYDELKTVTVERPSPDRIEPVCRYATLCGGCSLQHLNPAAQIAFKRHLLFDRLRHALNINKNSFHELPDLTDRQAGYRRKARLAVRHVARKGGTLVGFREKFSTFITDMNGCAVLVEPAAALIEPLRHCIDTLQGRRSIPQIEVAVGEKSGEQVDAAAAVALIVRHLEPLSEADTSLWMTFGREHGCQIYLQPKGLDTVHKLWPTDNLERLYYHLPDYRLTMAFHPLDFVQVNAGINRRIIPLALQLLDLRHSDSVLDLFCGLGNFTLPLARHCRHVTGIEGSSEMVRRGMENASTNTVDNVAFHAADLCNPFKDAPWAQGRFDKILLDPPRSGALEILDDIAALKAAKIVYISCNPATLARDAAVLGDKAYRLCSAGVMDMFPHTAHVESIAEFEFKGVLK